MADSTRRFLVPVPRVEQEVDAIRIAVAKAMNSRSRHLQERSCFLHRPTISSGGAPPWWKP